MSAVEIRGGSALQLTVAVPAYNVESYLMRGLESYLDPRFVGKLEVVVVDDGSTDGTRALAEEFAARSHGVIRVISKKNGGHGSAVNAGLAEARGRYFRVVDGDDWVNADGMAVTGRALDFSSVLTNGDTVFQIMIHTLTARTDYLRGIGIRLLEHTFYEDYEYVVKASVPASTICYLDIEVYQYLVGNENQSVSQANYVRRWDDHDRVVMELLDYLERCEHGEVCAASGEKLSNESVCYVREKVHLIVDTHYNIALLFDEDRRRGRARAKAFRRELRRADIDQWARGEQRYRMAMILNRLSFSYNSIKRLVSKRRH